MPPKPEPVPRGGLLDAVATWREAAYRWRCPACSCTTNLRGLLREICAHCGHQHFPDVPPRRQGDPDV